MKKLSLLIFGAFLFLGMPALTFAEEGNMPASENQFEIIADVNIYNPYIISQEGNDIQVGFTLSNGKGAQSDIRYSARLVKQISDELRVNVYQKIYDDRVTLAENSGIDKGVLIEAPTYLDGEYEVWIFSQNGDGLPLSSSMVGVINLKNAGMQHIDINESTCSLSIKGLDEKYSLRQGVDISPNEELNLSCEAESFFDKTVTAKVSIETFRRTIYGDRVSAVGEMQTIIFNPKEKKKVDISIPQAKDPQAYDIVVTLMDDMNISNTITAHYVIQGDSATISNLQLDKSTYVKGDKGIISFVWALSADSFLGSRTGKKDNKTVYYSLSIKNEKQEDCVKPIEHRLLTRDGATTKTNADIIRDCAQPVVNLAIEDENRKILAEKGYDFSISNQDDGIAQSAINGSGREGIDTKNIAWVVIGIVTLMALMAMVGYGIKNRSVKLFVWLVLGGSMLMVHGASAATITHSIRSTADDHNFTGTAGEYVMCEYTAPTSVSAGANFQVTSSGCVVNICSNDVNIAFYMGSNSMLNSAAIPAVYNYGAAWINKSGDGNYLQTGAPAARTLTAPAGINTYKVPIKFNFDHLTGGLPNVNIDYGCTKVNSIWSCPDKFGASVSVIDEITSGETHWNWCPHCVWLRIAPKGSFSYSTMAWPQKPTLMGPTTGYINTSYNFTASAVYDSSNYLRFEFDWDSNNTVDQTIGGIAPSSPTTLARSSGSISHQWPTVGTKNFKVRACKNQNDAGVAKCSVWSDIHITVISNPPAPVAGACGTKNRNENNTPYATTATLANWNADSWCANGTTPSLNGSITLPAIGQTTANWTCSGINGSTVNATNCHASRDWYHCTTNPLLDLSNASQCPGYDDRLSISETRTLWDTCDSDKKCEYKCNANFHKEGNTCKCDPTPDCTDGSNICIGGSCDKCDDNVTITTVPGTKDCRDLNWREVAPN
jgi:hypothetical protein